MKVLFMTCLLISISLIQFTHAKKRKSKKSQVAIVQVDGAAVYKVPNFDSPIIAYLNKGRKIRASKKIYPGIGGLGNFYKVRLKKRKYGYITDVDLFPAGKKKVEESGGSDIFVPDSGGGVDPTQNNSGKPIAAKRYLGISYNLVDYNEVILGTEYKESIGFFGLKLSGPKALLVDLPLELNILGFFGSPTYYGQIYNKASGFVVLADLLYTMPIIGKESYMVYVGLGPMLRYSSQQVEVTKLSNGNSIPLDAQYINMGGAAVVGLGLKLGESFAIKAEGKYYYEEQSHIVFGGALQFSY